MVGGGTEAEPGATGWKNEITTRLRQVRWSLAKTGLRRLLVWYRHRGLEPEDAFVAGYPRSGTTWIRFMLYEILSGGDAGFERVNRAVAEVGDQGRALRLLPGKGRLLKTHELYRGAYDRAIYLVRDPRDVVISEYHYLIMKRFIPEVPFDRFLDRFLLHKVNTFGSWTDHVRTWLDARDEGRVELHTVRYEDLLEDTQEEMEGVCQFLSLEAGADAIHRAIESNTKKQMRKKEDKARHGALRGFRRDMRFVRQASSGTWRETLDANQVRRIEEHAGEAITRLGYPLQSAQDAR